LQHDAYDSIGLNRRGPWLWGLFGLPVIVDLDAADPRSEMQAGCESAEQLGPWPDEQRRPRAFGPQHAGLRIGEIGAQG
jgi:hypothetical protein